MTVLRRLKTRSRNFAGLLGATLLVLSSGCSGTDRFVPRQELLAAAAPPRAAAIDQFIVTVADNWNSNRGLMQCYTRAGAGWKPLFTTPVHVLLGKKGLAWGIGAWPVTPGDGESYKKEGDWRSPAGCFAIGKVYGYPEKLPEGANYPYRKVGKWDAWVDDVKHPLYNRHVVIDPKKGVPGWFEKEKMRHGDFAYHWLLEVRHNSDPPKAGFGSAIFFHTRRGPNRVTSGCTTMAKANLEHVLKWLRAGKNPHYVLLPRDKYASFQKRYGLPSAPVAVKR